MKLIVYKGKTEPPWFNKPGDFLIQCDCGGIEWDWGNLTYGDMCDDDAYFKFPGYPRCSDCRTVVPKNLLKQKLAAQQMKDL